MSSGNFQKAFLNNFSIFITPKGNKIILHQAITHILLYMHDIYAMPNFELRPIWKVKEY